MKKGFTLAEILIVLTIIGVMAVMTIPSLMQNANSQHKITMFKKGINAAINAYSTEFATKTPPSSKTEDMILFNALAKQLNVKYYLLNDVENDVKEFTKPESAPWNYFIVTEDGITYSAFRGKHGENGCSSKLEITEQKSSSEAENKSCLGIGVFVGMKKRSELKSCSDDMDLTNFNDCNLIAVFIGTNGITAGNPDCTIAGRIMSDNIIYDPAKCVNNP